MCGASTPTYYQSTLNKSIRQNHNKNPPKRGLFESYFASGNLTQKVLPLPTPSDSTQIWPP